MENKNCTKHPSAYKIISIVVIVILAILFTFPLYWIITGSFKTNAAINSTTPIWWPKEWTLANYQKLFSRQTAPLFQFNIPFSSLITGSRDFETDTDRTDGTGCSPLADQYRIHGDHVHDPYLYHSIHGRICACKEEICGTAVPFYTDRMRNGITKTGYFDPITS